MHFNGLNTALKDLMVKELVGGTISSIILQVSFFKTYPRAMVAKSIQFHLSLKYAFLCNMTPYEIPSITASSKYRKVKTKFILSKINIV